MIQEADYILLNRQLSSMIENESNEISILANASALLNEFLPEINWVGFYLRTEEGDLVLGPFQGKIACMHIAFGRGVCGSALKEDRSIRVQDVHLFPGHIACDCASNSELVIPLRDGARRIRALLDIDSPIKGRFSESDQKYLESFCAILERSIYE